MMVFAVLRTWDGMDRLAMYPAEHFWIVSATALLSGMIGTALALSVESVRTTRTVYLALGFIAVALIFATHGLGTPGYIVDLDEAPNAVVISAGLSQFVGSVFIAMSILPASAPGARLVRDHASTLFGAAMVLLAAYVATMVWRPEYWDFIPQGRRWETSLAVLTMLLLAVAGWRYFRAWRLTELPGQLSMVLALAFLVQAQVSMYWGETWHLSWWMYHGLLLLAFLTLVAGWALEAARAKSLIVFSRALELADSLDRVTRADDSVRLDALEAAVESKDAYTRHHMGRVAEYAGAIARELGLAPERVELAVTAGRIHDVGKITIPDAVLLKPGRLTPDEFEMMKHHAHRGAHIARQSAALRHVADVIRAHHERFDGRGYPDGLAGEGIPLEARVVSVADVFDALTSNRVYRSMRPSAEAAAELERVAGTQLDPDCVDAFLRYLRKSGQLDEDTAAAA